MAVTCQRQNSVVKRCKQFHGRPLCFNTRAHGHEVCRAQVVFHEPLGRFLNANQALCLLPHRHNKPTAQRQLVNKGLRNLGRGRST